MSKAARGTKRICKGCGAKFYDLNKEPITCPLCDVLFEIEEPVEVKEKKAATPSQQPAEDVSGAKNVDAATPGEGEIAIDPALEDADLSDLGAEDVDLEDTIAEPVEDDGDDTFLVVDDEGTDDVSGIIGDVKKDVDEN